MKTSKDVGLYIKSLRESRGLTQEQLGEIVGVQKAAVQKWESGTTQNLKRTVIKKLSEFFDVSAASFIVKTDNEVDVLAAYVNNVKDSDGVNQNIKLSITTIADSELSNEQSAALYALIKTYISNIKDEE